MPAGCVEKSELVAALKKVLANPLPKAKSGTSGGSQAPAQKTPQSSPPKSSNQPKTTAELVAALKKSVGLTGQSTPKISTPPKFTSKVDMPGMFKKAAGSSAAVSTSASPGASDPFQRVEKASGLGMTVPPPAKANNHPAPNIAFEKVVGVTVPPPAKQMNGLAKAEDVIMQPTAKGSSNLPPQFAMTEVDVSSVELDPMMEVPLERSGPPILEDVLKKNGKELFRELLRIYSTAVVDDYFKDGIWKDDLMRDDYVLLDAHRKEACAISPPDLEDVVVPEPNLPFKGIVAPWASGSVTIVGPTTEYEFMMKWRLDPARTKVALGTLSQQRRYYVFMRFRAASLDIDTNVQLSNFIHACQMSGSWDKVGSMIPTPTQIGPAKASSQIAQASVVPPKSTSTMSPAAKNPATQIATPIASKIGALSVSAKRPPAPPSDPELDASKKQRIANEGASSTMLQPSLALRLAATMSDVGPIVGKASRVARPPILGKRCNPASKVQVP